MLDTNIINQIFARFKTKIAEPKTELESINEFTLLVAIVLSAQATDIAVNKATKALFVQYNTPQKIMELGEIGLKTYIKSIGLYNSKAKNILKLAQILAEKYDNNIPTTLEELEQLPGVGSKTARVFLNCARQEPWIAVDTHVFRVSNRLGLVQVDNVKQAEKMLPNAIPKKYHDYAHHWLILHGRYICKARKPECENCFLSDLCEFKAGDAL